MQRSERPVSAGPGQHLYYQVRLHPRVDLAPGPLWLARRPERRIAPQGGGVGLVEANTNGAATPGRAAQPGGQDRPREQRHRGTRQVARRDDYPFGQHRCPARLVEGGIAAYKDPYVP